MSELQTHGSFNLHRGMWDLSVWHVESSSCCRRALNCSMRHLVPQPGVKPGPPALGVLATGPPEKSLSL